MILISKLLPYMVLIFDFANTFFLRPHQHQNVFRDRRAINNRTACVLPDQPENGFYRRLDRTVNQLTLEFGCKNGYKLSSNFQYMICTRNGWIPPVPRTCIKICKPLLSTDAVTYTCKNRDEQVPCDEATDGTSATVQCSPYYEPEDLTVKNIFCWNGYWDKQPQLCQPECGKRKVEAIPLIINGQEVSKGDYPWSTAVFLKDKNGTIRNVCGGSMLTQRIILTAAHCVTAEYGKAVLQENILVGVGKFYRKYNDPRDTQAQYSKLSKLIIHEKYKGEYQRFANDIALLITEDKLLLSKVVQPVCYQGLPNIHLNAGTLGVITGWGLTTKNSNPSEELHEINMPYIPDSVCSQELPTEFADRYFTLGKMCAGYYNKSTGICRGDSGGGLAFKNRDGRFYVHGILSVSNSKDGDCDVETSALFTKVANYYDWLEEHISKYSQ